MTVTLSAVSMSEPERRDGSQRLAFLDGWRAVAVLIVIASHVTGFRHDPLWLKQIARWLPVGEIGVLIFFFISGFVISRSAFAEIRRDGDFSVRAFYIRRFFRIIPPLALYLVACLALGALGLVDFRPINALPAFLYVCNIGPFNSCIWLGGHTWSLAYEEQFYLLFPALLVLLALRRRPLLPHLVGALIFCALPLFFPLSYAGRYDFFIIYALFGAGALAARFEPQALELARRYGLLAFFIGILYVLAMPITLPWPTLANLYPLGFILAIPLMVFCAGTTAIGMALAHPAPRYIGRISYGIYLWQELATSDLFRHRPLAIELIAVLGVVALCALLYEVMERPLIALGRRLATQSSLRSAATLTGERSL